MNNAANTETAKDLLTACILEGYKAGREVGASPADTRRAIIALFIECGVPSHKAAGMVSSNEKTLYAMGRHPRQIAINGPR